ncbi:MAG: hypothetical protein NTZ68_01570 [Candidatus Dependentiae bacterium]|nr:hypothetical protein [Candidatus Dependentiae bacterium]
MLWFFVSQYQWTTIDQNVPLCFYQNQDQSSRTILAPDNVMIKISGPRKEIYQFDPLQSAVHIDASSFDDGNHEIQLSRENLFLPDSVKLVQLIPSHISIQISAKDRNHE